MSTRCCAQEDPAKTIAKWTRIAPLDTAAEGGQAAAEAATNSSNTSNTTAHSLAAAASPPYESDGVKGEGAASTCQTAPTASRTDGGSGGADFFVPWHLPYHRAEAARAAKLALAASAPLSGDGGSSSAVAEAPKPKV